MKETEYALSKLNRIIGTGSFFKKNMDGFIFYGNRDGFIFC